MKVHLVNAPILESSEYQRGDLGEAAYPQLGVLYLAGYIRNKFPELDILVTDGMLKGEEKVLEEVGDFGAEVVGISCLTPNASGAYKISKLIKKRQPETLVVIGGVHPTALPKEALKKSSCDLVVLGEGETVLVEIIEKRFSNKGLKKRDYREIKGVGYLESVEYRKNSLDKPIMNLDEISFPARDLVDLKNYLGWTISKRRPETAIFSTRGCPFNCHFCSNIVWKLRPPYLRLRSPKNIMDEVEVLVKDFGIREYFDHADEINSSIEWLKEVCKEKIRRKIGVPWKAMLRADVMTKSLARLLAKSGCWYVHLGIESGNQRTLDGIGKRITLKQVERTCKILKEQGIKVAGLFMLFNVWEKEGKLEYEGVEETEKTLDYAEKLVGKGLVQNVLVSQTTPYPGSELYQTALKYKLIRKEYMGRWEKWNHSWSLIMKVPGVSKEEMMRIKKRALKLQTFSMLKTGNLPWGDVGFLMKRGMSIARYLVTKK